MIPTIGPLLTGSEIYRDERGKSLGCFSKRRTVVTNDHCLVRRPVSLTAYLRQTRIKLKTQLQRRHRAAFKTHLLHILIKEFRLDRSNAAAWGVNGMSSSLDGGLPLSVGDPMPTIGEAFCGSSRFCVVRLRAGEVVWLK